VSASRRGFLLELSAVSAGWAAVRIGKFPVGLELYSFRREMAQDVPATLAMARNLGFADVEVPQLYKLSAREFRKRLDDVNLTCSAMVASDEQLRSDTRRVIEDARILGAKYVIYPWIPHPQTGFSRDDCLKAAADFNRRGEQLRRAGLSFCYHPHGYEFGPSREGALLDTLIQQTDKSSVSYQMDVFWIAWPGQDPVVYLKRYPGRFPLMHLKDLRKGAHGNQTGIAPETDSVSLGTGQIDFKTVLRAAEAVGVRRYYIEDESPAAREQITRSLHYLGSMR
jgi:sugar phosphate isomerase/epimerase